MFRMICSSRQSTAGGRLAVHGDICGILEVGPFASSQPRSNNARAHPSPLHVEDPADAVPSIINELLVTFADEWGLKAHRRNPARGLCQEDSPHRLGLSSISGLAPVGVKLSSDLPAARDGENATWIPSGKPAVPSANAGIADVDRETGHDLVYPVPTADGFGDSVTPATPTDGRRPPGACGRR